MPPWHGGGNMIRNVTFERTVYQPPPVRFEAGTTSIADLVILIWLPQRGLSPG